MEESSQMPKFMICAHEGKTIFINLGQIRVIDEVTPEHCRIMFEPSFVLEMRGEGAKQVMALCATHSVTTGGIPFLELDVVRELLVKYPKPE